MSILKLSQIWIYPIKSLGGIRLSSSPIREKGLPFDRRWMLVDDQNVFMTQRVHPSMALFKLSIDSKHLHVKFHNDTLSIPLHSDIESNGETVTIWDDQVTAHEVSEEFSAWFSQRLNMTCKLMFFPESNERVVDKKYAHNNEHVSLADAFPFLIIGQSSLDDLNDRLKNPVPQNRFRPNFIFTGGAPFEEDTWNKFTIGKNNFLGVKPCARCVLTTVDQETAVRSAEPLRTLASYRTWNNKVFLGQNVLAVDHLQVNEGDTIVVHTYSEVIKNQATLPS